MASLHQGMLKSLTEGERKGRMATGIGTRTSRPGGLGVRHPETPPSVSDRGTGWMTATVYALTVLVMVFVGWLT